MNLRSWRSCSTKGGRRPSHLRDLERPRKAAVGARSRPQQYLTFQHVESRGVDAEGLFKHWRSFKDRFSRGNSPCVIENSRSRTSLAIRKAWKELSIGRSSVVPGLRRLHPCVESVVRYLIFLARMLLYGAIWRTETEERGVESDAQAPGCASLGEA